MTISIGRAGLDTTIQDPSDQVINGRQIQWSGHFNNTALEAAKAIRQQLTGYINNPDELWVPIICGHDASLTGFYRVLDASVGVNPGASYNGRYWFPYSVTVEQVPGYGKPLLEALLVGALRTNVSAITATNMMAFYAIPQGALPVTVGYTGEFRTGAEGADGFGALANPTLPVTNQFLIDPADPTTIDSNWFQNAAKLESLALDGATYRTVIGRNIPYRTTVGAPGNDWRLSNGYVRVAPAVTTGATNSGLTLNVEHYDGAQWETAKAYTFSLGGTSFVAGTGAYFQIAVLRNDPSAVSIRLAAGTTTTGGLSLDITLRRGSRFLECRWSLATAGVVIVARGAVEAATAVTGGIRATSNDASGNRYVLAAAQTTTNDLVNGKITSGSVTAYDFMIGSEIAGSGASTLGNAQNQIYQWICAQSETYRLVGR